MSLRTRNRLLITVGAVTFAMMLLVVPPFSLGAIALGALVMVFSVGRDGSEAREAWPTNRYSMGLGGTAFTVGLVELTLLLYRP